MTKIWKKRLGVFLCVLSVLLGGTYGLPKILPMSDVSPGKLVSVSDAPVQTVSQDSILEVTPPKWDGVSAYDFINGNVPFFDLEQLSPETYEHYSSRDELGRCQTAEAVLGMETMPTEERGKIGHVKPSGWQTVKYDCVEGKYLYNRCHLIGFQLAGENDNRDNLITGTRFLNTQGMLPFENEIAEYIRETGHHVKYRVTPVYTDDHLVCDGVFLEAASVEDNGIRLCVYCYNVQPGVIIDYADGKSRLQTEDDVL